MLTTQHRQEGLSRAYVQAIAALGGYSSSTPTPDYGIDLTLHEVAVVGRRRIESGRRLDVQAKASTGARVKGDYLCYDVSVRDYETLRFAGAAVRRILVVLVLPPLEKDWLLQTTERLVLRDCAYWMSLRDWPATRNRRSIRLFVPLVNVFSVEALREIFYRVRTRGEP